MFRVPEEYRVRRGPLGTDESYGNNGMFLLGPLRVIASDGEGWEHVSVSLEGQCPSWHQMSQIKSIFWEKDDLVVQYHPPKADYVNCHPYCLHLWRKSGTNEFCERPPKALVGGL